MYELLAFILFYCTDGPFFTPPLLPRPFKKPPNSKLCQKQQQPRQRGIVPVASDFRMFCSVFWMPSGGFLGRAEDTQ